jgi:Tfp pilus assembly protein PilV
MVTRGGFGIVEVIVALTLLSVGMLGVAASAIMASRLLRAGEASERDALAALEVIDSLVLAENPTGGARQAGQRYLAWRVATDSLPLLRIEVDVTAADGSSQRSTRFRLMQRLAAP